jgi:hypothetical protein
MGMGKGVESVGKKINCRYNMTNAENIPITVVGTATTHDS